MVLKDLDHTWKGTIIGLIILVISVLSPIIEFIFFKSLWSILILIILLKPYISFWGLFIDYPTPTEPFREFITNLVYILQILWQKLSIFGPIIFFLSIIIYYLLLGHIVWLIIKKIKSKKKWRI